MLVIAAGGLAGGLSGSIQASSRQAYKQAYNKAYYAAHRDAIRAKHKAYREENRDAISAYHKAYIEENRDAISAQQKEYYAEHRDARLAYQKEYYAEHRDAIRAQKKACYAEQKRREQAYLGGFDWRTSEAVKWIENSGLRNKLNDLNIKDFNLKVLNCIIEEVSLNEGLQVPRVAKKNRACAYKFINDHIDAFKQNLNNLTLSKLK